MPSRSFATLALVLAFAAVLGAHLWRLPERPHSRTFTDELFYAQGARDIAEGGFPRFNRGWVAKYPPLYPFVLAPVRAAFGRDAFPWWSRVLNAVLLSACIFPAYRLLRLELARKWAVPAAILALIGGPTVYARFLLSENLLVLLFLVFLVAVAKYCRRPSHGRALFVGVMLGAMMLTKTQLIVAGPAAVIGVAVARGGVARASAFLPGFALGAALLWLPWKLRSRLFASEEGLANFFGYFREISGAGVRPLEEYAWWLGSLPGTFVVGVGPPALLLGGLWLGARARGRAAQPRVSSAVGAADEARGVQVAQGTGLVRSDVRGVAVTLLLSVLLTWLLVSVYKAQVAEFSMKLQERYFSFLWPPLLIAFCLSLRRPRLGWRTASVGVALMALWVLIMPSAYFDPETRLINLTATPSSEAAQSLSTWLGGIGAARGAYAALLAPVLLLPLVPRTGAVLLVALELLLLGFATVTAPTVDDEYQVMTERRLTAIWGWLDEVLEPGDLILHHTELDALAYQNSLHYEMDLAVVEEDLQTQWKSTVEFQPNRGRYELLGGPHTGRAWLLTWFPGPAPSDPRMTLGRYRLLPLDDGLEPLGQWLGPPAEEAQQDGVYPDAWCAPDVELKLPVDYPGKPRIRLVLLHPLGSPIEGDLSLRLRTNSGVFRQVTLAPGEAFEFDWGGNYFYPELALTITADKSAELPGFPAGPDAQTRPVSFRLLFIELTQRELDRSVL